MEEELRKDGMLRMVVKIKHVYSGYYPSLLEPAWDDIFVPAIVDDLQFIWRLGRHSDGKIYIELPRIPPHKDLPPVVLGTRSSSVIKVASFNLDESDDSQKWTF
ncbi:hypothetical protein B0O80DRAFT_503680 [Mortierella sp. GBAus27b]|nr:hypothetical protein B0O80DRAFT_503680 [Mortierella sp. GBAus27b]